MIESTSPPPEGKDNEVQIQEVERRKVVMTDDFPSRVELQHEARAQQLRDLDRKVMELPTSEAKARLGSVLSMFEVLHTITMERFIDTINASMQFLLHEEIVPSGLRKDYDPVSEMPMDTLRAIGRNKELREWVEKVIEAGVFDEVADQAMSYKERLDQLDDDEQAFLHTLIWRVKYRTGSRLSLMRDIGKTLDMTIFKPEENEAEAKAS